jgi:ubiquinone/menaquinone biosynthesis C-methylase UbiE
MTPEECRVAQVYGDTFALYDAATFDQFKGFLERRLAANDITHHDIEGKRCLDAGCGGGRASILLLDMGAAEVVGVDLSARNVATCTRIARERGHANAHFRQCNLLDLPFEDASFDVVFSNGVLHHTQDPDQALWEVARVLRTGGRFWLYLYGAGGMHWHTTRLIRPFVADIPAERAILHLTLQGQPVRRIAECIDDWYVPFLHCYTDADVSHRLGEFGFADARRLMRGETHDSSQRILTGDAAEAGWMGEGDLRYWAEKTFHPESKDGVPLPGAGGCGSPYEDSPAVLGLGRRMREILSLEDGLKGRGDAFRIALARSVFMAVRSRLETPGPFDADGLADELDRIHDMVLKAGDTP